MGRSEKTLELGGLSPCRPLDIFRALLQSTALKD